MQQNNLFRGMVMLALAVGTIVYISTNYVGQQTDIPDPVSPKLVNEPESDYLSNANHADNRPDNRSAFKETEKEVSVEEDPRFASAESFNHTLLEVTREWRQTRGYHLIEDFLGYHGPETYTGDHPYGYLSEDQLRGLAEQGDRDAQLLYGHYYLRFSEPKAAIDMFRELVINTEQTSSLANIAVTMIHASEAKQQDTSANYTQEQIIHDTNEAYAHFVLMRNRHDPLAERYLEVIEYNSFSPERIQVIEARAVALYESFNQARVQRGLPEYQDEPLDLAGKLGVSQETLEHYQKKYSPEADQMDSDDEQDHRMASNNNYGYDSSEDVDNGAINPDDEQEISEESMLDFGASEENDK